MQAIGYLSRREHSRQELRTKLLDSLRKRAREDAALEAAAEKAAQDLAQALREQPANGIDDAFAPTAEARAPANARARAPASARTPAPLRGAASRPGVPVRTLARDVGLDHDGSDDFDDGDAADIAPDTSSSRPTLPTPASTHRAALDTLTLGTGAALPARLRASLAAPAGPPTAGPPASTTGASTLAGAEPAAAAANDDLERTDPEAAVDQLLDWLVAHQYLSDTRFVESRVNARSRKQGALRIKLELSRHGLALEPDQAATLRATEFARAQALWQRKFGAVATEPRERAKQARFLASRGFGADVVRRIVGGQDED